MSNKMKKRLVIVTTVPETLASILKGQPRFLNSTFDVSLVSSPEIEAGKLETLEGVPVYPVPMFRGISLLEDFISIVKMIFLLRRLKPDVVHSYTPKAGLVAMVASLVCRVPVRVHTFTGLIFPTQRGLKQKLLIWVDRLICLCATKVVPEGNGVKKDLIAFNITSKPMNVIGYGNVAGVDFTYFDKASPGVLEKADCLRETLGISKDDFVFCFIGRLNNDKGLSELAAAFQQLPARAHLIVVGGIDTSAPVDATTLSLLQSNESVHLVGHRDDVRSALSACTVLVLPSYREGFPNVLLQAGAMGKAAIATDINGCNEIIEPGVNGWLVPARQIDPLLTAMCEALDTPAHRLVDMGGEAFTRVARCFDQKEHWQRMLTFYNKELRVETTI